REREQLRGNRGVDSDQINNLLAEKYGYFELLNKVVLDYHTQEIKIPTGMFKSAQTTGPNPTDQPGEQPWQLQVFVKCESGGQYMGMARYDFYILANERSFAWNFVKGAFSLWLRLCIILALAVTCSTYLSGVISFMAAAFLYVSGFFQEYVKSLAEGTLVGGGPLESLIRLAKHQPPADPLGKTPASVLAQGTDSVYRWLLRRVLDFLPDVDHLDLTDYVAEGFNIATVNLLALDTVMVIGYLLPWAVVAYYLIKTREIATW